MCNNFAEYLKRYLMNCDYLSIIHGDFFLGNILLSKNRDKVGLIDWQTCKIAPCFMDLQFLLFGCCHPKIL